MQNTNNNSIKKVKVFEAFAGVGITRLALEDLAKKLGIEFEYVGYSEIEPCSIKGYQAIHGNDTNNYGDITKIVWEDLEDVDFLTMTFPCQSLSSSGANEGFREGSGTKSALGWVIKDALKRMKKKPRTIFVENVGNILSPKHRATFDAYVDYLKSEGYFVNYMKIDASKVGWPQHRVRVYLLATLGYDLKFDWPKERPLDFYFRDILEKDVDPKYHITPALRPNNHMLDTAATHDGHRKMRIYNPTYCDKSCCITTRCGSRNDDPYLFLRDVNDMPRLTITRPNLATYGLTLQELKEIGYRKLTPREVIRLMGLTREEENKLMSAGLSDTSIYFTMGNSIIRPVLSEIFKGYFEALIKNNLL